jgi:hypothetical protein
MFAQLRQFSGNSVNGYEDCYIIPKEYRYGLQTADARSDTDHAKSCGVGHMNHIRFSVLLVSMGIMLLPATDILTCPSAVGQSNPEEELVAEGRALLKGARVKAKPDDALLAAYAAFIRWTKNPRQEKRAELSLPQSIRITTDQRPEKRREIGKDINLPFLREMFQAEILGVHQPNVGCFQIRTATTGLWFVKTKPKKWKLYLYIDKPIE